MRRLFGTVILLTACVVCGQTPTSTNPPNSVRTVGGGVSPPSVIYKVEPEYSEDDGSTGTFLGQQESMDRPLTNLNR